MTASEKASVDTYINENLDHILEIAKSSPNYIDGQATLSSNDGTIRGFHVDQVGISLTKIIYDHYPTSQ